MKNIALILCLLFGTDVAPAVVVLPPPVGTNQLLQILEASRNNAALNNGFYNSGRIDRLEHEVNRLETGFLILAILFGSSLASVCLLAARDEIHKLRILREGGLTADANKRKEELVPLTKQTGKPL